MLRVFDTPELIYAGHRNRTEPSGDVSSRNDSKSISNTSNEPPPTAIIPFKARGSCRHHSACCITAVSLLGRIGHRSGQVASWFQWLKRQALPRALIKRSPRAKQVGPVGLSVYADREAETPGGPEQAYGKPFLASTHCSSFNQVRAIYVRPPMLQAHTRQRRLWRLRTCGKLQFIGPEPGLRWEALLTRQSPHAPLR